MYRVDANISRSPSWVRSCPLSDFHHCWFGLGISLGDASVEMTAAQIVEMGNRYLRDSSEIQISVYCPFPFHNLLGGWPAQIVMQFIGPGQQGNVCQCILPGKLVPFAVCLSQSSLLLVLPYQSAYLCTGISTHFLQVPLYHPLFNSV